MSLLLCGKVVKYARQFVI